MPATKQAPATPTTESEQPAPTGRSSEEAAEGAADEQPEQESQQEGQPQDTPDDDMPMQVRCPLCGDTFDRPQALHGHLRFSHDLRDRELDEVYERAQSDEYIDFPEEDESGDEGEAEDLELTGSPGPPEADEEGSSEEEGEAVARAFDWEARLGHMEELRSDLNSLDRSREPTGLESFFGKSGVRDEGVHECLEALDEMEVEVRERLGMSTVDRNLQRQVDRTLDKINELVRCREQREALEQKFSDRAGTPDRVARLDDKEKEIREHVRGLWDAGKPPEDLDAEDPVADGPTGQE